MSMKKICLSSVERSYVHRPHAVHFVLLVTNVVRLGNKATRVVLVIQIYCIWQFNSLVWDLHLQNGNKSASTVCSSPVVTHTPCRFDL